MIDWLASAFVATSLLVGAIFLLRRPVARIFGPRAAYALWALPALRMAMPPLPGWRALYLPFWRFGPHRVTIGLVSPGDTPKFASALPTAARAPGGGTSFVHFSGSSWMALLVIIWTTGATMWFSWQMLRYLGFIRHALQSSTPSGNERGIDVVLTEHVDGPVAAGIFRRRVFLPPQFMSRYTPQERQLAILHEIAHHDRSDILANLAGLVVLALHWWNPIAHLAYRYFRNDQELACDATVLERVGSESRYAYGSAILKSASARTPGVSCALSHKNEIKRRLRFMARKRIGSPRQRLGLAVAIIAIGSGLAVTASGRANAPNDKLISRIENGLLAKRTLTATTPGFRKRPAAFGFHFIATFAP